MLRRDIRGKYATVLREQSRKHSKNPLCAYKIIENMFPDAAKLEMFARNICVGIVGEMKFNKYE